ncbi:MAG: hypothetical protein AAF730_02215 [Bacteroidota bacterium]
MAQPDFAAPSTPSRDALLDHADALYAFAQAVTTSPTQAAHLVEATYQRAYQQLAQHPIVSDEKAWLFQLLHEVRDEQDLPAAPSSVHQQLVDQVLQRVMPVALAALPDRQRLLLLLCDGEGFSLSSAQQILGLPDELTAQHLDAGRTALQASVWQAVAPSERRLLTAEVLAPERLKGILQTANPTLVAPLPDATRENLAAVASGSDRPAPEPPADAASSALGRVLKRSLVAAVLIFAAGSIGYLTSEALQQAPERDVIRLAAAQAEDQSLLFETASLEQAENMVLSRLSWRLTLPEIDAAPLAGVSIRRLTEEVSVPVFLYEDQSATQTVPITLVALNYALLTEYGQQLELSAEVLQYIEAEGRFQRYDEAARDILVWRYADEIYVAITPADAEMLQRRIVFPS